MKTMVRINRLLLQGVVFLALGLGFSLQAWAAITFAAVYSARGTSTTATATPTTVAGVADGNLYVLQLLVVDANCSEVVPPSGWTQRACQSHGNHIQAIYTRPAQAADLWRSFSFSLGTSREWLTILSSYSGVDLINPLDAPPVASTFTNTKNATSGSMTTQTPGALAVLLTSASIGDKKGIYTQPTGWAERAEISCKSKKCSITTSDRVQTTPGTVGPVTTTLKNNASGIVYLLALRPFSRVAYWPLDGLNWLADATGNGHTLTAYGSAVPTSAKVCTGFNGTGSTYLTANDSALLDLPDRYTLAAWVYPTAYPTSGLKTILSKDENYEIHLTSEGKLYWWWTDTGNVARAITSQGIVPLNQWSHVAVVFERTATSQQQRVFINGVQESITYSYTTAAKTNTVQLYIGSDLNFTSGTTSRNFLGLIDEVYIYSGPLGASEIASLMAATHPCAVDHYRLKITDGSALTCESEPVSIEACADATCSSIYPANATISLAANNGATINGAASPQTVTLINGVASPTIQKTTAGITLLTLSSGNPAPTSTVPYRCFIGASEVPWSSCQINFQQAKLTLDIPDFTACTGTSAATITADGCASTITGSKSLRVWMGYVDPSTGQGETVKIGTASLPTARPASINLTVTFDADGEATLPLVNYDDAGSVRVYAELIEGSLTLTGQADFDTAPEKLRLSAAGGSCVAPYHTCNKFKSAGEGFPVTLQALCTSGSTEKVTKNFRFPSIPLQHTRMAPDPGANGALTPTEVELAPTDLGKKEFVASLSEVGVFSLSPLPIVYKGFTIPTEGTGPLGRFYPSHFDTEVVDGCSGFTYSGQPFGLRVIARNRSGEQTLNYAGAFAKNVTLSNANGTPGQFTRDLIPCTTTPCINATDFSGGVATLVSPKRIGFELTNKATAPVTLKVRANDDDTASAVGQAEGQTLLRSGRLTVSRAHSALETQPVSLVVKAEYYDGSLFKTNDLDQCTSLSSSLLRLDNSQEANQTDGNIAVGAGSSSMSVANGGTVTSGVLSLVFSAPGAGNSGFVDLTPQLGSMPWLRYDWDGDGSHDDDPKGRASWGMYRGNKNVIYLRERWN